MQYVRMLTNSFVAGALVGAYVTLLVLQLNPAVPLHSLAAVPLVLTWWVFYGIHASVFFYVLFVIRQLMAEVRMRPFSRKRRPDVVTFSPSTIVLPARFIRAASS